MLFFPAVLWIIIQCRCIYLFIYFMCVSYLCCTPTNLFYNQNTQLRVWGTELLFSYIFNIFFFKPTYLCLCSFFHSLSSGSDLCAVLSHNKISKALIFILEEIQWCRVRVMITFWSFERHRDKGLFCAWWHSVCSLCRYRQIFTHCVNISDSVEAAVEALSWHYTNFQ